MTPDPLRELVRSVVRDAVALFTASLHGDPDIITLVRQVSDPHPDETEFERDLRVRVLLRVEAALGAIFLRTLGRHSPIDPAELLARVALEVETTLAGEEW